MFLCRPSEPLFEIKRRFNPFKGLDGRTGSGSRLEKDRQETELIAKAKSGEADAFGDLIRIHQAPVFGYCLRHTGNRETALDLTNEVFLRAFRRFPGYDPTHPLRNWLIKIAVNLCIDHHRRRPPPEAVDPGELARITGGDHEDDPEERLVRLESGEEIRRAVEALPPNYRSLVILYYFNQLSYQAISEALELPIGTVSTWLHRAKNILRRQLSRVPPAPDGGDRRDRK